MKPITIVGGGLAGLTLGIKLRQNDVPVTLVEAGSYPRHRVCGEFISGVGVEVLQALDVDELQHGSMQPAVSCAFFSARQILMNRRLPARAVTVSRFHLDAALAKKFRELGGDLREGERSQGCTDEEGAICALGRRAQSVENGWRWFGLKLHARQVELTADLEMHIARDSYVGLCRLAGDEVNVCGLFRRKRGESANNNSLDWLRGERGSQLFQKLEHAEFDSESICAVAGLSLRPQPIDSRECRIGDALTMIPPITGNGMSMAFESAQLAVEPILSYARGESDWSKTTAHVAEILRGRFACRLRWAALIHRVLFSRFSSPALEMMLKSERGWRAAFAATGLLSRSLDFTNAGSCH